MAVSICPRPHFSYPFDQGLPITIVGYEITHILTNPTAEGYMVVGSGHQEDGADVFAMTGGTGTTANTSFFPSRTGIPQGAIKTAPGDAHVDVYGTCDVGKEQALVNIFYTSP